LDKIIEVVISKADVKKRAAMVMIFVLQWSERQRKWCAVTLIHGVVRLLDGLWKLRLNGFLGG
jgi:hypothetical protein